MTDNQSQGDPFSATRAHVLSFGNTQKLASGLHEIKCFPWSSFLFGHME